MIKITLDIIWEKRWKLDILSETDSFHLHQLFYFFSEITYFIEDRTVLPRIKKKKNSNIVARFIISSHTTDLNFLRQATTWSVWMQTSKQTIKWNSLRIKQNGLCLSHFFFLLEKLLPVIISDSGQPGFELQLVYRIIPHANTEEKITNWLLENGSLTVQHTFFKENQSFHISYKRCCELSFNN